MKFVDYPHPNNHEMQLYNLLKAMLKQGELPPVISNVFLLILNWLSEKYPEALGTPKGNN